ncbi:protein ABCI7, chloroplastic-like [Phragmites australis]|uniref:protein ABCI7, chloroplastic-like n=1 Tax=Phragmites australis TaxID=29695 RepID=UPI002D79202A|nr:protein ABCI7, chloroplastic-like [Phragmites australis]
MSSPSPLCAASCCSIPLHAPPALLRFRRPAISVSASATRAAPAVSDDLVLRIAEQLEDSVTSSSSPLLDPLRSASALSLLSTPWPTRRSSEAFRFTDISYLRSLPISLPSRAPELAPPSSPFPSYVLFCDGILVSASGAHVSALADLPHGRARDRTAAALAASAEFAHKDLFFDFNAVGARDIAVVHVPEGVKMANDPVHIMFTYTTSSGGSMLMSNPRVLVVAEKEAEVAIVEEHFGVGEEGGFYWANPVVEIVIDEGARVVHSYVQRQSFAAAHTKWTVVQQDTSSKYEFVEVSTGARLNRHNLHIQQLGPETETELSTLHLTSQNKQIHDLHSRLILDHPRGFSRQLHKCIACGAGNSIFDGNIKVNRYAQQTDAGQETKCLILSPKALVNVKPNLQIIADDVKCTHGAAISGELDPNELFYFQARGINKQTATDALLFFFGGHVIKRIPFKPINEKILAQFKDLLTSCRQTTDGALLS